MAATKFISFYRLSQYDGLIKTYIDNADAKSIKRVDYDSTKRELSFYKEEAGGTAVKTVTLPEDVDITGKLDKITGATAGDVVTVKADGTLEDGGVKLSDLSAKVGSVGATDASIAIGGTAVAPTVGVAISAATGNALTLDTDGLKVVVPAATDYSVKVEDATTPTTGYLKTYIIKQGEAGKETEVGKIDIPKDLVVTSGTIVKDPAGQTAGTYLELTIANQATPVYINVADLCDAYTVPADQTSADVVVAISATNEVSATLSAGVKTSLGKADSAVQKVEASTTAASIKVDGTDVTITGVMLSADWEVATESDINGLFV